MDYQNSMFVTASYDSQLISWKEVRSNNKNIKHREFEYEKLREVVNCHGKQQIVLMEVSFYHNLIVTSSNGPTLLFWNHEFGKLIGTLTLENESEPTAMAFVNSFSLIVIADNLVIVFSNYCRGMCWWCK